MSPPVSITAGDPASTEDAKWELLARDLPFQALPAIRSVATKWAATIASITGVFGIVTLVKGPSDIAKLSDEAKKWVGVLVGFAVLSAVVAIYLAASAAQGSPKKFRFVGQEVKKRYKDGATVATFQLRASKYSALLAVLLLAIGIGVTWYKTPAEPKPASEILVVDSAGVPTCGSLQAAAADNLVIQPATSKSPVSVPLTGLRHIAGVATCPGETKKE